jgi:hypothetical protein
MAGTAVETKGIIKHLKNSAVKESVPRSGVIPAGETLSDDGTIGVFLFAFAI